MLCPNPLEITVRSYAWSVIHDQFILTPRKMMVPCGKCGACRTNLVNSWVPRFLGECKTSDFQLFLTLTYADTELVYSTACVASVDSDHVQRWLKRVRKEMDPCRIRYYLCAEYGGRTCRPHYHVLLFGSGGDPGQCEDIARAKWPYGHVHCGSVGPASIRYVANFHVHKCATPEGAVPSFTRMSRRPGIGGLYFDSKLDNVVFRRFHIHAGQKYQFGRYFRNRFTQATGELPTPGRTYDDLLTERYGRDGSWDAARRHVDSKFNYLQRKHNKL